MHYPPGNYRNGLGFTGPPGAPTVTSGGVPIVSYTSSSGWAAKPILATGYYQPTVVATGEPIAPQYDGGVPPPAYVPPGGGLTLSREQIQAMIDRDRAAAQELLARQGYEEGDGFAPDLEQKALEDAARARAIAEGAAVPGVAPDAKANWMPLAVAAALIYFMSG